MKHPNSTRSLDPLIQMHFRCSHLRFLLRHPKILYPNVFATLATSPPMLAGMLKPPTVSPLTPHLPSVFYRSPILTQLLNAAFFNPAGCKNSFRFNTHRHIPNNQHFLEHQPDPLTIPPNRQFCTKNAVDGLPCAVPPQIISNPSYRNPFKLRLLTPELPPSPQIFAHDSSAVNSPSPTSTFNLDMFTAPTNFCTLRTP